MAEAATNLTWAGLLRAVGRWFRENLPQALVMTAISFAFAWLVNFVVMAFRWDGFRAPTEGGSDYIAAEGSLVVGSLFWVGLSSLVFALVSYGHRAGWGQLREEVFGLPARMGGMFRGEERNRSLTTLAWAMALSLLLGLVVSPAVAAVTAGFFVVFAATPLGVLLVGVMRRLWIQLVVRFAPHDGEPSSEVGSAAVSAVGMVIGFAVALAVDPWFVKLAAFLLAGLAAYYFANEDALGGSGGGTAVLVLLTAGLVLHELFEVGIAFADDGGWSECGDCNVFDYVTSTGATEVVSRSTVAAGASGVGAPVGAAVGDILGSIGGGTGGGAGTGGGTGSSAAPTGGGTAPTSGPAPAGSGDTAPTGGGTAPTGGDTAPTGGDTAAVGDDLGGDEGSAAPPPPDATEPTGDGAATQGDDDADAILGAIGGGEGGGAATPTDTGSGGTDTSGDTSASTASEPGSTDPSDVTGAAGRRSEQGGPDADDGGSAPGATEATSPPPPPDDGGTEPPSREA